VNSGDPAIAGVYRIARLNRAMMDFKRIVGVAKPIAVTASPRP
jgi:hypothetical protein